MQTQAVIGHITGWLKDYALNARAKGFVVGVSGGIDSAVVSALAARTGLSVLLLDMPIRQKADQSDRAQEHIRDLTRLFPNVNGQTTDGLWDTERTDEEQMGASYPELEWAMSVYGTAKPEDFEGRRREVLEIYTRLHKAMQHKVNPIPVCTIPAALLE